MNRIAHKSQRKKTYRRIGIAVVVCALVIFINPAGLFTSLRAGLTTTLAPFQKIAYVASYNTYAAGRFFSNISELRVDNERLRQENQTLAAHNAQLTDLQNENTALRTQCHLSAREQFETVSAEVIARDGIQGGTWITVDRGSRDGVRQEMAAIVGDGILIGRVVEVFPTTARILLVIHPESIFGGVTTQTQARGVVRGAHGLTMRFEDVLQKDLLTPGDLVVSENINDRIPRGLLIGTIQNVTQSQDGLFQQATIHASFDLQAIRFVSIILHTS